MKYILLLILTIGSQHITAQVPVKIWQGTVDTNWHNPANWDVGAIPGPNDRVSISDVTNDPVISEPAFAKFVGIGVGATLTIADSLIVNDAPFDISGITSDGTVTIDPNGVLQISNTGLIGFFNRAGATLTNEGEIEITDNFESSAIGSFGHFTNHGHVHLSEASNGITHGSGALTENYGEMVIEEIQGRNVAISFNAQLDNHGDILIKDSGFGIKFEGLNGILNNHGNLVIQNSYSAGIDFKGDIHTLTNYGQLTIENSGRAGIEIQGQSTLTNEACGQIDVDDRIEMFIYQGNAGTITNQGYFSLNTSDPSILPSGAVFQNQGVFHDRQGSLNLTHAGFSNDEIVITESDACSQSPIETAFLLGNSLELTIEGIYVDSLLSSSGGIYNGTNNTFTPMPSLSAGSSTYYVHVQDPANGNCSDTLQWIVNTVDCCPNSPIYVNKAAPAGGNGSSWANAYQHLQDALAATCGTDFTEIWVATNQYYPDEGVGVTDGDRDTSFVLQNKLSILGGFPSTGSPTIQDRDPEAHPVFLVGDVDNDNSLDDNSYHVVSNDGNGLDSTAVLDGFTIIGGNADGSGSNAQGAGIYNFESSPYIVNCQIRLNVAIEDGGGVYNFKSNTQFDNVAIEGNRGRLGAGIYSEESSISITRSTLRTNVASGEGGAMFFGGPAASTITNCKLLDNNAVGMGGAVMCKATGVNAVNCEIQGNESDADGGALVSSLGAMVELTNCSFFANTSPNAATIRTDFFATTTVHNSILWGGIGATEIINASTLIVPSTTTVDYSIVQGGWTGAGNLDEDPLYDSALIELQITVGCSPAINAGLDSYNDESQALNQSSRFFETIDMGAYEYVGDTRDTITYTGLSSGDAQDWHDRFNWDHNAVPSCCHDVVIPAPHDVRIYGTLEGLGKTLDVQLGAKLETDAAGLLDVRRK